MSGGYAGDQMLTLFHQKIRVLHKGHNILVYTKALTRTGIKNQESTLR